MTKFASLSAFYWHYEGYNRHCTLDDVDQLKERLSAAGYYVKEYKNSTIVIKTPEELEAARQRRLMAQREGAENYTKLGAAIPKPMAQAFASACRKLGITQSEALSPAIHAIIKKAEQTPSQNNGL
jgi:FMN phosphatase YigB (HAD superfamily)